MARAWLSGPSYHDQTYAVVDGQELCLDLYLPFWTPSPPLVIYIHGGGWQTGSYKEAGARWLTGYGFAVASVQHRFSQTAKFPAQIHDIHAAIRWLRAYADRLGYQADHLGMVGVSSGGHLAMLAGTNTGDPALQGQLGNHREESVHLSAVVNYFGASDLILRSQSQPEQTEPPYSVVHQLLGHSPTEDPAGAKLASPAYQVGDQAAPLFIIHGEDDPQVLIDQAHRMVSAYEQADRPVLFEPVAGGGHGGAGFSTKSIHQKVVAFLSDHLQPTDTSV